jgi:hypothetical protein
VDEGLPIAYEVLEKGVPVYATGGEQVGTVDHVVSAEREDIFHGVVIGTASRKRFVAADQVASIHERGVDLTIDAAGAATLPEPRGGAPSFRANEPGTKPSRWTEMLDRLRLRDPHRRDWSEED